MTSSQTNRPRLSILALFALGLPWAVTLSACATAQSGALWLRGGHVWTGDPSVQGATALYAENGRVVAVGSDAEVAAVAARGRRVRAVDLGGRTVVPGFIDAHVHILSGGLGLDRLDL